MPLQLLLATGRKHHKRGSLARRYMVSKRHSRRGIGCRTPNASKGLIAARADGRAALTLVRACSLNHALSLHGVGG